MKIVALLSVVALTLAMLSGCASKKEGAGPEFDSELTPAGPDLAWTPGPNEVVVTLTALNPEADRNFIHIGWSTVVLAGSDITPDTPFATANDVPNFGGATVTPDFGVTSSYSPDDPESAAPSLITLRYLCTAGSQVELTVRVQFAAAADLNPVLEDESHVRNITCAIPQSTHAIAGDVADHVYQLILGGTPPAVTVQQDSTPGFALFGAATGARAGDRHVAGGYATSGGEIGVAVANLGSAGAPQTPNWNLIPVSGATAIAAVADAGTQFVFADVTQGVFTTDGLANTPATSPETPDRIACGGGTCVGTNANQGFLTSADAGAVWIKVVDTRIVDALAYGNGRYVGNDIFNFALIYSDDNGATWNLGTFPNINGANVLGFGNGRFVGWQNGAAYYSDDGITWTAGTVSGSTAGVTHVAYSPSGGVWIAVGIGVSYVSTDGITWTADPFATGAFPSALTGL